MATDLKLATPNLQLRSDLRRHALAGNEWALDMLLAEVELNALAEAVDTLSQKWRSALERSKALNTAQATQPPKETV